ncbi:MAG: ribbon-helix-helix domain-containing protein [Alphaproteobacteria bacterium]|nr:ribbon-helix-helix domain-containing protein [Alphaproteobacteria bacterium]
MKSEVISKLTDQAVDKKRSVVVSGHRTSVSLEPVFWEQLGVLAAKQRISVNELVTRIDQRKSGSLTSAIRVFVLKSVQQKLRTVRAVSDAGLPYPR